MSSLRPSEKRFLEDFFEISSEHVLDFDERRFAELFDDLFQIDIYGDKYSVFGSTEADRLRAFWKLESDEVVGELLGELAEFWLHLQPNYMVDGSYSDYQRVIELAAKLKSQPSSDDKMSGSETEKPGLEILGELGRGGFGIVHRVRVGKEIFARKSFEPRGANISRSSQEKLKERFCREISAQQNLPDGIAIPIVDCSMDDDPPWFLMPVADLTLDHQIKVDKSSETIFPILLEVLSALDKLHRLGRVHRDLAPSNIFKLKDKWLLGDLGLISPSDSDLNITSSFSTWGRLDYSAPELSQHYSKATARADIYSFGCILHEIFVGESRIPYRTHSGPGPIGRIIEKCTYEQPVDRYQKVEEIIEAIKEVLGDDVESGGDDYDRYLHADALLKAKTNDENLDAGPLLDFVLSAPKIGEKWDALLAEITAECLSDFFETSPGRTLKFVELYCAWISARASTRPGFGFGFCDTLVGRLVNAYGFCDDRTRIPVIKAAFRLGVSHNRWRVLDEARTMIGTDITDDLAKLVVLEFSEDAFVCDLVAASVKEAFLDYHPIVARKLRKLKS